MVNSPGFIPFISKHVDSGNIIFIPNGVISSDFNIEDNAGAEFRKKSINAEKKRFVVSYTGNMGVANDLESIIESARILRKDYPQIFFFIYRRWNER